MKIITGLLILLLVIIGLGFALLNAELITLNYYFGTKQMPLSLCIVLTFALGGLLGLLSSGMILFKLMADNNRLKRQLKHAEREAVHLQALPIKDSS